MSRPTQKEVNRMANPLCYKPKSDGISACLLKDDEPELIYSFAKINTRTRGKETVYVKIINPRTKAGGFPGLDARCEGIFCVT